MHRIAIVVSTVGYHWEELFSAFWVYKDAGADVRLFTVDGKAPKPDLMSLKPTGPLALVGLGLPKHIAPSTPRGSLLQEQLDTAVSSLNDLDPAEFDALYLPGGHGCLFDVNQDATLHGIITKMYERGCLLTAVCHATSTFSFAKHKGASIIKGHTITGFPHALDKILIAAGLVRPEFLPLPLINDHELKKAEAKHSVVDETLAFANPMHWTSSLPFITGMGPKSAASVASALIEALDRKKVTDRKSNVSPSAPAARAVHNT